MEKEKKATPAKKSKSTYGKGGRKTATAQAFVFQGGKGNITVNGKDYKEYFPTDHLQAIITGALAVAGMEKAVDVNIKVSGGGKVSQAEACRHGIARALEAIDNGLRPALKAEGYLKRDPRVKERKKPGLHRARRAPQWSKR